MPETEVAEAPAAEPTEAAIEESTEAPDPTPDDSAAKQPSLADLIEGGLDEVLSHPKVAEHVAETQRRAEQSARNRMQAEQRRSLNPEVVTQAAAAVLGDAGIDPQNLTKSQADRLNNLYANVRRGAAEQLAEEIPNSFFSSYELSDTVRADYLEAMNRGDVDAAFATLVDGAVALKTSALEAENEQRIKDEVEKRVKQELEAAGNGGSLNLPSTTRGSRPSNVATSLTTAEIADMPYTTWNKLPADVKEQIKVNVQQADADRGAETVDRSRLERVADLAT